MPDSPPNNILDIGCGPGYLTRKLAEKFAASRIVGLDIAPGMIAAAKQKMRKQNLRFIVGDGESFACDNQFDLIVSNASLQWMDLEKVFNRVEKGLKRGGWFIFNTFGTRTLAELKTSGFRVNDFVPKEKIRQLAQAGFKIVSLESRLVSQSFKSVKELICHLKELGAASTDQSQGVKFNRKRFLGEPIAVSFEVICGCLSKPL